MRLFTYCIPVDDGAAPNPFWGVCTLAICKPDIRKVAKVGDWVAGTGSHKHGNQNRLVYAMKVTETMTMEEYDTYCNNVIPNKIPDVYNKNYNRQVGDSIYDFSHRPPFLRKSVHFDSEYCNDLRGKRVLLSDHFYYFGDNPIEIPLSLRKVIKKGQRHKSNYNEPYKENFIKWLEGLNLEVKRLYGKPLITINFSKYDYSNCSVKRSECPNYA